eukprot:g77784.t1
MSWVKHSSKLWTLAAEKPGLMKVPLRATAVQLAPGEVWLHSPTPMADGQLDELRQLGDVKYIVAPNVFHHLSLAALSKAFPSAVLAGAAGVEKKQPSLRFTHLLQSDEPPPQTWGEQLQQTFMAGLPVLNETVFLHPESRTLIATDILFNFNPSKPEQVSFLFRLYLKLAQGFKPCCPSLGFKYLVQDKAALHRSLDRVFSWDFDRIVMCHGDIVETGGKQAFHDGGKIRNSLTLYHASGFGGASEEGQTNMRLQ